MATTKRPRYSELRIVLLGWTGSGKTSAGNTILGQSAFDTGSGTEKCVKGEGDVGHRRVTVVDTPGWKEIPSLNYLRKEIVCGLELCPPGPHALLLVMRLDKEVETRSLEELLELVSDQVWRRTIVLFTHSDVGGEKGTVEQRIADKGEVHQKLLKKCGNRYHVFNNDSQDECHVKVLLEKIELMVAGNAEQYLPRKDVGQVIFSTSRKPVGPEESQRTHTIMEEKTQKCPEAEQKPEEAELQSMMSTDSPPTGETLSSKIKNIGPTGDYTFTRRENNMDIYQLKLTNVKKGFCRKLNFGKKPLDGKNKTIMLMGATGSGKTTLINGMINYALGVKWEDPYRFELIPKETNRSEAHSQTAEITAYQIYHSERFRVPYSLTIIDTPGFGDTSGIKRDQEITEKIRHFFSDPEGIATIDVVGFVVQSALQRLTPTQKYIFDSILSIFGKDIANNIILLFTFADGKPPAALEAIKTARIPCANLDNKPLFFKFNYSVLFSSNSGATDTDSGDESGFDEMFWKMGTSSMQKFLNKVNRMESQSLQLTKEVLEERRKLEVNVEGLLPKIRVGLMKLDEVNQTLESLEKYQTLADENEVFEYEVDTPVVEKIELKGVHTTTCRNCNFTCHEDCAYVDDRDKAKCWAMSNDKCRVCERKCPWYEHSNLPHRFVYSTKKEKRTYENLKKNYEEAMGKQVTAKELVKTIAAEYQAVQQIVLDFITSLSECQKRLGEIALQPNPLTAPDYIDLMIKSQEQEGLPGFKKRIEELRRVREGAVILQKVSRGERLLPEEDVGKWTQFKKTLIGIGTNVSNWIKGK